MLGNRFFRPQVSRFIILFVERAGSTYLSTLLNSHPHIHARREQFSMMRQRGQGDEACMAWVQEFFNLPFVGEHKAFGFKTKMEDIPGRDAFATFLQEKNVKIIQLQRRNSVKAVVSTINARRLWEKSGNWNLLDKSDRMPAFAADLEEFDALLQERARWDRELTDYVARLHLPTLPLLYEELLQDEEQFLCRVFDFLDVEPKPVEGKTYKHTRDDLRQVLLNFDQLRAHYVGTRYAPMFDEVLLPAGA